MEFILYVRVSWDTADKIGVRKEEIGKRWYWSLPTD